MKWRIPLVAIAIGFVGLTASCIYMENPWEVGEVFYGYPLLWLETSKNLWISFPPVPLRVSILWVGFFADMLLYSSFGFVVSYLVFSLRENMKLLRFFIKRGIVFLVGSYMILLILSSLMFRGPTASPGIPIIAAAGYGAFFFSAVATPACTIIYGYYRLIKRRKSQKVTG